MMNSSAMEQIEGEISGNGNGHTKEAMSQSQKALRREDGPEDHRKWTQLQGRKHVGRGWANQDGADTDMSHWSIPSKIRALNSRVMSSHDSRADAQENTHALERHSTVIYRL